ncbi:hypothetical protein SVAN01_00630 [Stagonosporopsis vannaccii]|nr:hypothetical protein SVAN01_00630 [Stagonosporopsis vannaccii]
MIRVHSEAQAGAQQDGQALRASWAQSADTGQNNGCQGCGQARRRDRAAGETVEQWDAAELSGLRAPVLADAIIRWIFHRAGAPWSRRHSVIGAGDTAQRAKSLCAAPASPVRRSLPVVQHAFLHSNVFLGAWGSTTAPTRRVLWPATYR